MESKSIFHLDTDSAAAGAAAAAGDAAFLLLIPPLLQWFRLRRQQKQLQLQQQQNLCLNQKFLWLWLKKFLTLIPEFCCKLFSFTCSLPLPVWCTAVPPVATKNGKTKSETHGFLMIFGHTDLIIGQSKAKFCEESAGDVRFCVAPQNPGKMWKNACSRTKF